MKTKITLLTLTLALTYLSIKAQVLVKDIWPGTNNSYPGYITKSGNLVYFAANDGTGTIKVFKSDGTSAGTSSLCLSSSANQNFTDVNGTMFFVNGQELWKSDGTIAGTILVKDINPGLPGSMYDSFNYLYNVNGTLFFRADNGTNGYELWKSDGTNAGTVLVKDMNPGTGDGFGGNGVVINNDFYFVGNNGVNGLELWKSDGTTAGTIMLKDINATGASSPLLFTNVNGTLFFTADNGTNGREIWKSDGTTLGTVMVKDLNHIVPPSRLMNMNGTLFFQGFEGVTGKELWKSDGTDPGTVIVKDLNPGNSYSTPVELTAIGTTLFMQTDFSLGKELWKTDGTDPGTVLVKDINPSAGSDPTYLTNVNGTLYFTANDGTNGFEIWKSDGTTAGTVMLTNINPGSASAAPNFLTNVNGDLFFAATDGTNGVELWKVNGSTVTNLYSSTMQNDFKIYPNPTSTNLNIQLNSNEIVGNVQIEVSNTLGQIVLSETMIGKNIELNTTGLSNGLYIVKMFNNNTILSSQKIIKQ